MKPTRLPASVVMVAASLLAVALALAGCAGAGATISTQAITTTLAVTTTQASVTTTTQVATTTTAAPTTTTLPEAAKLERYRADMTALWAEYDPKMAAFNQAWLPVLFGSGQTSTEDAQKVMDELASTYRGFMVALTKADPPQSLAAAHAAYVSGNQKMADAIDQVLAAMKEAVATQKPSVVMEAVTGMLTALEDNIDSMTEAETTLRTALGVEVPKPTRVPNAWVQLGPENWPGGCFYSPLVYDPSAGTFILLDGASPSAETCSYDPEANNWSILGPSADPPYRDTYAMAYTPANRKVILFGGAIFPSGGGDMKLFSDTWAYSSADNTWTDLKPAGAAPSARAFTSVVCDPASGKVFLFGGLNNSTAFNDTWSYDPLANKWTKLQPRGTPPAKRGAYAMAYDSDRHAILLFGGMGQTALFSDMWSYDPAANKWTKIVPTGAVPSSRFGASMVYNAVSKRLIMFGGQDSKDYLLNDTWSFDPATKKWTQLKTAGTPPSPRLAPAMAYDPVNKNVLLFGGANEDVITNETWVFFPGE